MTPGHNSNLMQQLQIYTSSNTSNKREYAHRLYIFHPFKDGVHTIHVMECRKSVKRGDFNKMCIADHEWQTESICPCGMGLEY